MNRVEDKFMIKCHKKSANYVPMSKIVAHRNTIKVVVTGFDVFTFRAILGTI